MKKIVLFLAVVAMIIAPAISMSQSFFGVRISDQKESQLNLSKDAINKQVIVVEKIRKAILTANSIKEEVADLRGVDSISGISDAQKKRLSMLCYNLEEINLKYPNIEKLIFKEQHLLDSLTDRSQKLIMDEVNDDDPSKYMSKKDYKAFKRYIEIKKGLNELKKQENETAYQEAIQKAKLSKLNSNSFTLVLSNESKTSSRKFVLRGENTKNDIEERSFTLKPGEILVVTDVYPQKYFCDIFEGSKAKYNNHTVVGIEKNKYYNGEYYNGGFIAEEVLQVGYVKNE